MDLYLGKFRGNFPILFLDDLLVYPGSFEEHLKHVKLVLQRIRMHTVSKQQSYQMPIGKLQMSRKSDVIVCVHSELEECLCSAKNASVKTNLCNCTT